MTDEEYRRRYGYIIEDEGEWIAEASALRQGFCCPKCRATSYTQTSTVRGRDHDIAYWGAMCDKCHMRGTIFND